MLTARLRRTEAFSVPVRRSGLVSIPEPCTLSATRRSSNEWSGVSIDWAHSKPLGNPDLVTVALKVPKGVVCLISALAVHRMTTQIPHAVYLAIPANDQAPALQFLPLRLFWYSKAVYENGIVQEKMDGTPIRVYSPEKTLADCFKYRNKLGIEVCVEALNLYRRRGRMKMDFIERFAKLCRVERVMRPYL